MALDTAAKRAAAAHVKRLGKGVTPDAAKPLVWRAAVAWNYGGNTFVPPVTGAGGDDVFTLGAKPSIGVTMQPMVGGKPSW